MTEDTTCDRVLGVHSLDHFTIAVPDLDEAWRFYDAFGLEVERLQDRLRLRTRGRAHVWADIVHGQRKSLRAIRFGIFAQDLLAFTARLADIRIASPDPDSDAIWCRTPDGLPVEVAVAPKSSPDGKSDFSHPARYSPTRGVGPRIESAKVYPRRLAHLAMLVSDVPTTMAFLIDRLGMRLSDRSDNHVAFLHGPHGSDHHMVALGLSDGPGMHHCSWDVATVGDVGQGAMQMAAAGYTRGWGVGRHVLGSNYFHYVRDPWGSYCEYSADMDYIPASLTWSGENHAGEDAFYQWGPPPPEDFSTNYETMPLVPGSSASTGR